MARRIAARKPLRQQVAENRRALAFMVGDRPMPEIPACLAHLSKAPKQYGPRIEQEDDPYEATIQAGIIEMLLKHPKVKVVERHNSGKAKEMGADGKPRFISYNKIFKVNGVRMRKADIDCTLVNGKRFVCEVKRLHWKRPTDEREVEQQNYIEHIRAATGYGMFARSVAEVEAALDAIQV